MPRTFTLPDGRQFTSKIEIPQKFSDALNVYRSLHDRNPVIAETALWTNLLALFQAHLSAEGTPTNAALETQFKAGRVAGAQAEREGWEKAGHARTPEDGHCRDYDVGHRAGYDMGQRAGKALGMQTCGALWNAMRARVPVPCADPPHVDVAPARIESAVQTSPHEEPSTTSGVSFNSVDWASDADAHLPGWLAILDKVLIDNDVSAPAATMLHLVLSAGSDDGSLHFGGQGQHCVICSRGGKEKNGKRGV